MVMVVVWGRLYESWRGEGRKGEGWMGVRGLLLFCFVVVKILLCSSFGLLIVEIGDITIKGQGPCRVVTMVTWWF